MENIENDPLALIRARHNSAMEEDFISQETEDMGYLLAALDAVLALHTGTCEMSGENCEAADCPLMVCGPCGETYPCPTVAAVSAALGGVQ